MRQKEDEVQLEIGISTVEPPGRNAVSRTTIDAQDVLDDIENYDRTDGAYKVALESPTPTSESWGGGGTGMILIAALVLYVAMNQR